MVLDVIAGPMIAMIAGIYIVLPAILILLVSILTIKLIKHIKSNHKEDET